MIEENQNPESQTAGAAARRNDVETVLRESDRRYRQLVENLPIAVYMCSVEGHVTLFNQAAADLWGREPLLGVEQWCGSGRIYRPDGSLMPPNECPVAVTLKEGRPVRGQEIIIERPDGKRRHVVPHPELLRDATGQVVGAVNILVDITERKRAEEAQALLAAIVESSSDAIVSITLEGRITSWNAGAERIFGYTAEEAVGQPITLLIPEERLSDEQELLGRIRAGGRIEHFETKRMHKDGRRIDVSLSVSPVRNPAGQIIGASKVARDVSARKQAEEALRESEERFARFMHHLPGLAWIKDIAGRYVFANEAAARAFQVSAAELRGKTDSDIFPHATAAQFQHNDRKALESETGIQTVETLEQGDGTVHFSLVNKFPIRGFDGAPSLVGGMAIDITDRKNSEEALRESEERFRTLASHAPVGIFVSDPNGENVFVNESWCTMAGLTPDEARGNGWTRALHPEDREQVLSSWNAAVQGCVASNAEFRFQRADGVVTWLQGNAVPLLNSDGRFAGYIGTVADITGLKTAEIALRESEERFRHMADHAPVMVWVTDPAGRTTFLGKSWYEFTGQTPETGLGFGWIDAVHPDDRAAARETFLAANSRQEGFRLEYRLRNRTGEYHWTIDAAAPRFAADGRFLGYIGSIIDISKRKRAEEALHEAREHLQLVTNTMAVAVTRCTADHRFVWVNPGYAALLGRSRDEIEGRPIREVIGEKAYETILPYVQRVLTGEKVEFEALVNYSKIGSRWVKAKYVPTYKVPHAPDGWVAVILDVTEEKRREEALRTSEQLYRAIGESNDYGVWLCDPAGRNVYASDSFLKLVGLTQEQCSNLGWAAALHPDDADRTLAAWNDCVLHGRHWDFEHRFHGADGEWHPVLARGVPVRNECGEITAWAGINLDISRIKEVENKLREADRRKDEFLAVLAHELRNPLAPIRTGLELLRLAGEDPTVAQEVRATMERQTQHMARLIDDLLDVSRITRGTIELRKSRVEIATVVQNAVETARPAIDAYSQQLTISLPRQPIVLEADPTRLAQVIANLLNNAAKYTEQGGCISLMVQRLGSEVTLSIKDSGIGIPERMLSRIFDMFAQLDHSVARSSGGLGIGLTLAKRLVEMHGGSIEARSAGPGQGSEFVIRLPVVVELLQEQPTADAESTEVSGKRRILVADDNEQAARMLSMWLTALGNEVRVAHDGQAAVELASEFRPDIALLDIGMPKLDGYDTARFIRRQPWGRDVVLAALTGWGQEEDKRRTREAGFDHHFVKPVEPAVLQRLLAD